MIFKDDIDRWLWQKKHMGEYMMNYKPIDKEIMNVVEMLYKRIENLEEKVTKYENEYKR